MKWRHVVLVLTCVLGGGCSGGGGTTTVTGLVTTLNGFVPGATVSLDQSSTTADSGGRFQLDIPSSGTSVLSFEKAGYAPAYLAVTPSGAPTITVSAALAKVTQTSSIDVTQAPATVTVDALVLSFPQGSIQTRSGATPDGPVDVAVTWLERSDAPALGPVPLLGTNGSEVHPLITMGMFDVSVTFKGEPCGLASGKTMGISLPAQSGDPAEASLWSVDPKQAIWVQEAPATNQNGQWTGEVPHLSWWNVDLFYKVPANRCACIVFIARTPAGAAVPGVMIRSQPSAKYTFGGWTEQDGTLCHPCFPSGETLPVLWAAFLGTRATKAVSGLVSITPGATGASCGSPECQEVPITVQCTEDAHCDPGKTCKAGVCEGSGTPPPPGKLLGSCDIVQDMGMCYEFTADVIDEATARDVCTKQQAIPGDFKLGVACPAANAVGTCTYGDSSLTYYRPMFEGAVDTLRSSCVQGGGSWS